MLEAVVIFTYVERERKGLQETGSARLSPAGVTEQLRERTINIQLIFSCQAGERAKVMEAQVGLLNAGPFGDWTLGKDPFGCFGDSLTTLSLPSRAPSVVAKGPTSAAPTASCPPSFRLISGPCWIQGRPGSGTVRDRIRRYFKLQS